MIMEQRPDPDALLKQITEIETIRARGKLKIFFGFAAGVGKTYAMLEAAHEALGTGIDVVVGYVEPHTRPETVALVDGLELLPLVELKYKDIILKEFNVDGAIKRKPQLILIDELAHTNAKGSRHIKRYQDVEELLKEGIDVYTTVNVQHIESLNDVVAAMTGIVVRERIPDSVFDSADQIKLVDIEPADLIARLNEGKVYKEKQAERALNNFFTLENLTALREIALRRTADRVNKAAEKNKPVLAQSGHQREHILVCISASPSDAKVIRTAARMVDAFGGVFTALLVETSDIKELTEENRKVLNENLKLAEQLGAKIATIFGDDIPYQVAEYARVSRISKIVMGRSNNKRIFFFRQQNFIEKLTAFAPNIDIYIIPDNQSNSINKSKKWRIKKMFSLGDILKSIVILGVTTFVAFLFFTLGFSEANIIIVYLLGVLITAFTTDGRFYGFVTSILSVVTFDFFFTQPYFTLQAFGLQYPTTFLIMFLAAFLTSTLTKRVKEQAKQASIKSYRTEVLLETIQNLQRAESAGEIINQTANQLVNLLQRDVIFYPVENSRLSDPLTFPYEKDGTELEEYMTADEKAVALWVYKNGKRAGATTGTLPGVKCLYLSVRNHDTVFAVVGIVMEQGSTLEAFEKNLFLAMLSECALALEKERTMAIKNKITMEAKQEQLRSNLLRAISHDLRTPLTSISGSARILMEHSKQLELSKKQELYTDIYDDSMWLINLVENLLSVTRIENGTMEIKTQPELISEVIEESLLHINRKESDHIIKVDLKDEWLMAYMDARLIIQVIINIVDNAIKYTKEGSDIIISAKSLGEMVEIRIADNGEGISDTAKEKLFEMFFTEDNQSSDARRGLGLGLSLCKSIVEAHGGIIKVMDNVPRGTIFAFTLKGRKVKIDE